MLISPSSDPTPEELNDVLAEFYGRHRPEPRGLLPAFEITTDYTNFPDEAIRKIQRPIPQPKVNRQRPTSPSDAITLYVDSVVLAGEEHINVHLSWDAAPPIEDTDIWYRLLRGNVNGGPYPEVVQESINDLDKSDGGLDLDTHYYYIVQWAPDPDGSDPKIYSSRSNQVHVFRSSVVDPPPGDFPDEFRVVFGVEPDGFPQDVFINKYYGFVAQAIKAGVDYSYDGPVVLSPTYGLDLSDSTFLSSIPSGYNANAPISYLPSATINMVDGVASWNWAVNAPGIVFATGFVRLRVMDPDRPHEEINMIGISPDNGPDVEGSHVEFTISHDSFGN